MKVRRIFFFLLILVVAVAGTYSSSFSGKFMLDDTGRITNNTSLARPSEVAANVTNRYLVDLTFALDYAAGGLNPAYFHFTNLLLHMACVLLLFMLVRVLLFQSGWQKTRGEWVAFLSALLWGLHPLTTSAVTYICQRYEVMMAFFFLLAMLALAEALKRGGWRGCVFLWVSFLSCLSGMFCKQVMITAPLVLFLLDVSFFWKGWRDLIYRRWVYYLGLAACWLVLGVLIKIDAANHLAMFSAYSADMGKLMYLLNQTPVLLYYLRLAFWPYPLTIDYAWMPVADISLLLLPALIVSSLFIVVIYGLIKWPRSFFAGACVFIILSPTSSFVTIPDLAYEHRMYLPLAGLITSLLLAVYRFVRSVRAGYIVSIIFVLLAASAGVATFLRNRDFADPVKLWSDVVCRIPHNFRARTFLAEEQLREGDLASAERTVRLLLARVELVTKDSRRNYNIPSSNPQIYRALGLDLLGRILLSDGRPEEALSCFAELAEDYPDRIVFRHNMALAMLASGKYADAERELDAVLGMRTNYRPTVMVKADMLSQSGGHVSAVALLRKVLQQDPDFIPARVELAWLLSASYDYSVRDSDEALSLLEGIDEELGITSIRVLDIRAAAFAGKGAFDRAVEIQELTVQMAREHVSDAGFLEQVENRLGLYRQSLPFVFGDALVQEGR